MPCDILGEASYSASVLAGAFPTAAPDRCTPAVAGIGGLVRRLGVPTPARSDGETRTGLQSREAKPSGGEPTSQWPTAASWRRSFQTLARTRATGDTWGQVAAASGEEFEQRGAPVRSAHCFRVSPDPGESWSTAMGSGRRHRQDGAGAARREDRDDLALRRNPRATVEGGRGVFPCGFPRPG